MIQDDDTCKLNSAELPTYKIYQYLFPSGKIYIGMTKNSIATRRDQGYQHNKPLQIAIKETGFSNIVVDILEDGLSQNEAFEMEKYYISKFQSNNPQKGFNISKGGKCTFEGLHHTSKHKQHMRELYQGRVFTEEHLTHLREGHKTEQRSVIGIMPNGDQIQFDGLRDAAESVGGYRSNISRACKNGKPYKGVVWLFTKGGDDR